MTDLVRIGPVAYPSITAAAAALQNIATPQLIDVNDDLSGAGAFTAIAGVPQATVTISGTVKPDGSLPNLAAMGTFVRLAWGKAILNTEDVASLTIQNLLLTNAACSDANGAGIRGNEGTKALHVKNIVARNNENGILCNGVGLLTIEDSLFDNNGQSSQESRRGYSHNVYLAGKRVEAVRSTFQDSQFGHDFKSRMLETVLTQCRMSGSKDGRAIDLSNGGILKASHCEFIKPSIATQNNLIHLAAEGTDGRPESYELTNCLFSIDIPYGRALQYVCNDGGVECVLTDPKFISQGVEISDEEAQKYFAGRSPVRIVLTGGPRGPQLPVGRAADAVAAPVPVVPVQPDPAPGVPAYGKWERAGFEGDNFTSPANTVVRYGIEPNWVQKTVSGSWSATNEFFGGDPAVGVKKEVQIYFPPVDNKPVGSVIVPVTTAPAPVPVPAPVAPSADAGAFMGAMIAGFSAFLEAAGYSVTKK